MQFYKCLTMLLLVVSLFIGNIALTPAYAIDATSWEFPIIEVSDPSPTKEWLSREAYFVLESAFGWQKVSFYDQFVTGNTTINVKLKKPYKDINSFSAWYHYVDKTKIMYTTQLKFKSNTLTLLDILSRYKDLNPEINTLEDMSKEIVYTCTYESQYNRVKQPQYKLGTIDPVNCDENSFGLATFHSKDKIFVDSVTVSIVPLLKDSPEWKRNEELRRKYSK